MIRRPSNVSHAGPSIPRSYMYLLPSFRRIRMPINSLRRRCLQSQRCNTRTVSRLSDRGHLFVDELGRLHAPCWRKTRRAADRLLREWHVPAHDEDPSPAHSTPSGSNGVRISSRWESAAGCAPEEVAVGAGMTGRGDVRGRGGGEEGWLALPSRTGSLALGVDSAG